MLVGQLTVSPCSSCLQPKENQKPCAWCWPQKFHLSHLEMKMELHGSLAPPYKARNTTPLGRRKVSRGPSQTQVSYPWGDRKGRWSFTGPTHALVPQGIRVKGSFLPHLILGPGAETARRTGAVMHALFSFDLVSDASHGPGGHWGRVWKGLSDGDSLCLQGQLFRNSQINELSALRP